MLYIAMESIIKRNNNNKTAFSFSYFSALSKGQDLPVKERLEMPVATQKTDTGLTSGLLKILHQQV